MVFIISYQIFFLPYSTFQRTGLFLFVLFFEIKLKKIILNFSCFMEKCISQRNVKISFYSFIYSIYSNIDPSQV